MNPKIFISSLVLISIIVIAGCTGAGKSKPPGTEAEEKTTVAKFKGKDCGADLTCFADASRDCKQAKFLQTVKTDVDLFGQKTTIIATTDIQTQGKEGGKCMLRLSVEGKTGDKASVKTTSDCKFDLGEYNALMAKWKQSGKVDAENDFKGAVCESA